MECPCQSGFLHGPTGASVISCFYYMPLVCWEREKNSLILPNMIEQATINTI